MDRSSFALLDSKIMKPCSNSMKVKENYTSNFYAPANEDSQADNMHLERKSQKKQLSIKELKCLSRNRTANYMKPPRPISIN